MKLSTNWTSYFHANNNNNWSKESYYKIYSFNTIENFWRFYNNHPNLTYGTYYLMRDDNFPVWEECPNGQRLSFILPLSNGKKIWEELAMSTVGETLIENNLDVIGIEIRCNTYHNTCVIKIWMKENYKVCKLNIYKNYLNLNRVKVQNNFKK